MLEGENIVCFAKDWTEDPTSNNHVMRLLARDNKVLWINSISTRTPSLASGSDIRKMGRKLSRFAHNVFRGAEQVDDGLWVFTPIVLPLPHNRAAQSANRQIVKQTIRLLRRQIGMDEFQLWTFLPTAVNYIGYLGESLVVYYITDEFSQFSNIDTERVLAMERELCQRADVVFCTSNSLLEAKSQYNPNTHLASHGVQQEHFSQALLDSVDVPGDVADLTGPVLGFFGLIHDWIDLELLAYLARERPSWNVVLIGDWKVDVSELRELPNVRLLGRKPYDELPGYCKVFDVALIPFVINELTVHVNPIKLREYLSAGLPVVSTPLPECTYFPEHCRIAATRQEFMTAVEQALEEGSPERRQKRSMAMEVETWENKVAALGDLVNQARERKVAQLG